MLCTIQAQVCSSCIFVLSNQSPTSTWLSFLRWLKMANGDRHTCLVTLWFSLDLSPKWLFSSPLPGFQQANGSQTSVCIKILKQNEFKKHLLGSTLIGSESADRKGLRISICNHCPGHAAATSPGHTLRTLLEVIRLCEISLVWIPIANVKSLWTCGPWADPDCA